jgi:hypothetical protein
MPGRRIQRVRTVHYAQELRLIQGLTGDWSSATTRIMIGSSPAGRSCTISVFSYGRPPLTRAYGYTSTL